MGNRKEEILIVALHLFARDGYEAVSVSQIAGELDMTKGALYRHYKSKRDIFDCIVQRMEQQDGEQARQNEVPEESIEKDAGRISECISRRFCRNTANQCLSIGQRTILHHRFGKCLRLNNLEMKRCRIYISNIWYPDRQNT